MNSGMSWEYYFMVRIAPVNVIKRYWKGAWRKSSFKVTLNLMACACGCGYQMGTNEDCLHVRNKNRCKARNISQSHYDFLHHSFVEKVLLVVALLNQLDGVERCLVLRIIRFNTGLFLINNLFVTSY